MSTYDGAYTGSRVATTQPYWCYPCTCKDEYRDKHEIDPRCDRCNKRS